MTSVPDTRHWHHQQACLVAVAAQDLASETQTQTLRWFGSPTAAYKEREKSHLPSLLPDTVLLVCVCVGGIPNPFSLFAPSSLWVQRDGGLGRGATSLGLHLRSHWHWHRDPHSSHTENKALSLKFPEETSGLRHSEG